MNPAQSIDEWSRLELRFIASETRRPPKQTVRGAVGSISGRLSEAFANQFSLACTALWTSLFRADTHTLATGEDCAETAPGKNKTRGARSGHTLRAHVQGTRGTYSEHELMAYTCPTSGVTPPASFSSTRSAGLTHFRRNPRLDWRLRGCRALPECIECVPRRCAPSATAE